MYKREVLNNKMQVITYQNNNIHSVNMSFYFKAGVEYETKDVKGISHLIEHLCFRNLNGMDIETLYNKMSSIGAVLRAETYKNGIRFYITVVNKYFSEALDIMKNLINNRDWTAEEISAEKKIVLNQIENKGEKSFKEQVDSIYYKNLNLQNLIMGNKSDVKKITVENINKWKKNILNTSNSCFILTGNFTKKQRKEAISELEKLESNECTLNRLSQIPKDFKNRNIESDNVIRTDWDISDINVSFDVDINKDNIHAVDILNSIIGGDVDSNISLELREKKAYTDAVFSDLDIYKDNAKIVIELSVLNKKLLKTLEILFKILKRIKYKIYDNEFNNNKIFFTDNNTKYLDDAEELNFRLGYRDFILEKETGDINDIINKYNKVSLEDVQSLADQVIGEKSLVISVTNNSDIIGEDELTETLLKCRECISKKHICPICNEYKFDEEYDICPICDWEHDLVQENDEDYSGGANELSVKEARILYKLQNLNKKLAKQIFNKHLKVNAEINDSNIDNNSKMIKHKKERDRYAKEIIKAYKIKGETNK